MKHKNKQAGFTIVELLIIIITVGIVLGIAITTFTDVRRKRHNSERQQDIKTLQHTIEDYYSQTERYPSLAQINDAAWRNKNLKSLQDSDLTDPSGKRTLLTPLPVAGAYSYQPTTSDDKSCDNITADCMKYVLTATQEEADVYTKNNYN
jgi:type II secretory pathway pseudopilin PulG